MTQDNGGNVTHELVGIPTPDGVKNIHPDMLKQYRVEAYDYLKVITEQQANFKDLMATVEEVVGIKKAVISKWMKARFKEETKKTAELAATFAALDEADPEPVFGK